MFNGLKMRACLVVFSMSENVSEICLSRSLIIWVQLKHPTTQLTNHVYEAFLIVFGRP